MKILGRATSGNVQKVIFLLEELGIDYAREDYGRQFGNTSSDAYLAMNPTGKVPTLVDGDLVVWESNSILRYIAAKERSGLYPEAPGPRSAVELWMDWLLASLNGSYIAIFKATKGGDDAPEAAAKEMAGALSILDGRLVSSSYLAGDSLTIADICLAPIVHRCLNFPVELPALSALRAWHAKLSERPAFKKATGV
jgi:glutathione S-transferase